ncbi:EF-hand domain-containing protein [Ferrovibrio sp.]|jgi:hypothetical protein|uniref:EF-hand domain-containing protein n=1 Tax=Ferrovibrio sp. TaxID=1917215 RepID=UPI0035AEF8D6
MVSSIGSGSNPLQQVMQQLFVKNDSNADGKLDSSEISSLLETLQGTSDASSGLAADDVIAAFDSDGDGNVTSTEFDSGFQKMAENMQAGLIAAQEGSQMPPPPPGPPPGEPSRGSLGAASEEDGEDDTTVSTLLDLLEQYSSTSESKEASASSDETSTDSLVQSFLAQLEKYARSQDYLTQTGTTSGSLSVSA